ncbi:hypothetical protein Tco_0097873, partial [Tanacetum coccineum]
MYTTRAQQQALDDELVALADLALDALKLTPFYNAFEISTDVPEIYMQELWIFEEPPLEEEILSFIRDLRHTSEIKFLSDVNVNRMHQPWRSFVAIINKCLSGKTTALESLRLSRAQILWGMYHNKSVDYVYLMWEDLVYQVENKNYKKNNDMDDFLFTTIRVISKHQDTHVYGVILPQHLTNQAMLESEAYITYNAYATVLYEVALTEAEQIKLATKRSLIQTHSSYVSGSCVDEGTGSILGVPDVPTYESDDEQISWKSSEEDNDDEVNVSKDNDDDGNNDDVDKDDEDDDADNQDDENLD